MRNRRARVSLYGLGGPATPARASEGRVVAICASRVGEGWLSVHGELGRGGGGDARGQCASEPDFLSLSAP